MLFLRVQLTQVSDGPYNNLCRKTHIEDDIEPLRRWGIMSAWVEYSCPLSWTLNTSINEALKCSDGEARWWTRTGPWEGRKWENPHGFHFQSELRCAPEKQGRCSDTCHRTVLEAEFHSFAVLQLKPLVVIRSLVGKTGPASRQHETRKTWKAAMLPWSNPSSSSPWRRAVHFSEPK